MMDKVSLEADCTQCAALCCFALAFDKSEDFPIDKPNGMVCSHLDSGNRCKIHEEREGQGYRGCISYDCLGAGQRVTQEVFKGRSWRNEPSLIAPMTEAFVSMLRLHRLLSLLDTASNLPLTLEEIDQFDQFMDEFSPEDGWNEDLLERFEESGAEKRVRAFLMSLRHHVV